MPQADTQVQTASDAAAARPDACPVKNRWLRRLGAAGFLFFLIKGLLWLTIPAGIAAWRWLAN